MNEVETTYCVHFQLRSPESLADVLAKLEPVPHAQVCRLAQPFAFKVEYRARPGALIHHTVLAILMDAGAEITHYSSDTGAALGRIYEDHTSLQGKG